MGQKKSNNVLNAAVAATRELTSAAEALGEAWSHVITAQSKGSPVTRKVKAVSRQAARTVRRTISRR